MRSRFLKASLGIIMTILLLTSFMPTAFATSYVITKTGNAPLYNALHSGYNLGDGTGITQYELASCTGDAGNDGPTLVLDAQNITNVYGLQYCTQIKAFRIDSNPLQNINPLVGMSTIQYLYLYQNQLTSLPALNMPNLKYLYLYNNYNLTTAGISNALSGCSSLQALMLDGTKVHSFDFLHNTPSLRILSANRTGITETDIDSLSNVSNQLTSLGIEESVLGSDSLQKIHSFFPNLQTLDIGRCNIENISALSGLALSRLTLNYNFVHDLTPLLALKNCSIDLSYNPLYMTTGSPNFNAVQTLKSNGCTVDTTHPYLFKVTFNCYSSMGTANSLPATGHYYGQTIQIPGVTAANPAALTFVGWDKAGTGATPPSTANTTSTLTARLPLSSGDYDTSSNTYSVIYTALFAPTQYTVKFNSQNGSAVANITAGYNTKITAPANPTRTGYTFAGWYKEAACTHAWDFAADTVTANITLFAKWIAIPAAPTGVKAVSASYNSIKISWNAVSGVAGYEVWREAAGESAYMLAGTTATTAYTNSSNVTGNKVNYKVRAYCLNGTTKVYGGWSSVVSATPVPAAPTVTATPASYNSISVAWSAVAGATKYEVYRSSYKAGTYSILTTTTALSYTNTGVDTGKKYYYKVKAYRLMGSTKVYGDESAIAAATTALGVPSSVTAVKASSTSIKVSWGAVAGATKYEIWRCTTSSSGTYTSLATTADTFCTNTGLVTGKTYWYKVRAYILVGSTKVYSDYSTVVHTNP